MTPAAFASYRQQAILGVSVTVALPLGQYDPAKLINIGTNRWSFRPEVGVSRSFGKWVVHKNYIVRFCSAIGGSGLRRQR